MKLDKKFMIAAIKAAKDAGKCGDYPIGSVIVKGDKIIAVGKETLFSVNDATGHAEMWAIRKACGEMKSELLKECTIYSTHEQCPMCAGAIIWAGIDRIVFGATRKDMINYMKKHVNKKFKWNQINVTCKYIAKR